MLPPNVTNQSLFDLGRPIGLENDFGLNGPAAGASKAVPDTGTPFGSMLAEQIGQINAVQQAAEHAVQSYAIADNINLHTVMTQVEKANLSMELTAQIRNKLVGAYQEIMRMQV